MKKSKIFGAIFLAIPLFAGCAVGDDDQLGANDNRDPQNVGYNNNVDDNRNFNRTTDLDENDDRGNIGFNYDNRNEGDNGERTQMEVADDVAENVANLDEVDRANVIVTNLNAYVAVILNEEPNGTLTSQVENKISETVRNTDRGIQNVFVSTNPNFIDRMRDYGDKIQAGEPIEGLFEEFNEMISRVFPNAR